MYEMKKKNSLQLQVPQKHELFVSFLLEADRTFCVISLVGGLHHVLPFHTVAETLRNHSVDLLIEGIACPLISFE